ncbi:retrovirus-related pol polyprotein from transposon TNT 1-94 [Tanacetum coccineum]
MSSRVSNKDVHLGEHRKQKPFLKFNDLQCPTCKKCLYSANHDECILEYLSRLNPRASAQNKDAKSHKTTKRYMPVEKSSASKKPERQIPTGHRNQCQNGFTKDELHQMASAENNTSGPTYVLKDKKASDYDNSDPVPPRQNVVPSAEKTDSSQQGLEFLFSPLLEEYYNPTHGLAEENNNDQAPNAHFKEDEILSILFDDAVISSTKTESPWELSRQQFGKMIIKLKWKKVLILKNHLHQLLAWKQFGFSLPTQHTNHLEKVYLLKKALYGLKQAPRAWYDELSTFLMSKGFTKVQSSMAILHVIKHDQHKSTSRRLKNFKYLKWYHYHGTLDPKDSWIRTKYNISDVDPCPDCLDTRKALLGDTVILGDKLKLISKETKLHCYVFSRGKSTWR